MPHEIDHMVLAEDEERLGKTWPEWLLCAVAHGDSIDVINCGIRVY